MINISKSQSQSGNAVVIVLVALVVVAVGALAYLSGQMAGEEIAEKPAIETAAGNAENPAAAQQQQLEIKPGNPVVAKVGGEDVSRSDVVAFIQTLPEAARQTPIDQLFPQALNQVILNKVIEARAAKVDLSDDPAYQERLDAAKAQIASAVFLENTVNEQITEERLQQAYALYVENFPEIEELSASHILVDEESQAKDLIKQLNDGADFAELAKANSTDRTAENGGDLGFFAAQDVVPEFSEAAFGLEAGMFTKEPVKSQFGYHVIKAGEKRQRPPADFEQAKGFLEGQIRSAVLNGLVGGWRNEARVEIFDINGEPLAKAEPAAGEEVAQ